MTDSNKELKEVYELKIDNDRECFKLLKKGAIKTSEGIEDEWIADIFELEDFKFFRPTKEILCVGDYRGR